MKFCFLFEVLSPAIFPPMKISKIPLSPFFSPPSLDFEKFQFPPDFVEFNNAVPPSFTKRRGGGGVGSRYAYVDKISLGFDFVISLNFTFGMYAI